MTIKTIVSDGSTTLQTFEFEYLKKAFVKVYAAGVETPFTWVGPYQINLTTAPAVGELIVIKRVTDTDKLVDFVDGSVLLAKDLNVSALQAIHVAEEAQEQAASALIPTPAGVFDAGGRRIKNVGTPLEDDDAVSKKWVETAATSQVTAAANERVAAESAQAAALASQNTAALSALSASGHAQVASDEKTAAAGKAAEAAASAGSASSAAAVSEQARLDALAAKNSAESASASAATSVAVVASDALTASTKAAAAAASADEAEDWAVIAQDAVQPAYGLVQRTAYNSTTYFERTSQTHGPMSTEFVFTPERLDTTFNVEFVAGLWTEATNGNSAGAGMVQPYVWNGSSWVSIGYEWTTGVAAVDNASGTGNRNYDNPYIALGLSQSNVHNGVIRLKLYGRTAGADRRMRVNRVRVTLTEERH